MHQGKWNTWAGTENIKKNQNSLNMMQQGKEYTRKLLILQFGRCMLQQGTEGNIWRLLLMQTSHYCNMCMLKHQNHLNIFQLHTANNKKTVQARTHPNTCT